MVWYDILLLKLCKGKTTYLRDTSFYHCNSENFAKVKRRISEIRRFTIASWRELEIRQKTKMTITQQRKGSRERGKGQKNSTSPGYNVVLITQFRQKLRSSFYHCTAGIRISCGELVPPCKFPTFFSFVNLAHYCC